MKNINKNQESSLPLTIITVVSTFVLVIFLGYSLISAKGTYSDEPDDINANDPPSSSTQSVTCTCYYCAYGKETTGTTSATSSAGCSSACSKKYTNGSTSPVTCSSGSTSPEPANTPDPQIPNNTPTPTATPYNCSGLASGSCNSGEASSHCHWCATEGKCKAKSVDCISSSPTTTATPTQICCHTNNGFFHAVKEACNNMGGTEAAERFCTTTTSEVVCAAGTYYNANGACSTCLANYYCPGVTTNTDNNMRAGLNPCPSGTTSKAGAKSSSECTSSSNSSNQSNNNGSSNNGSSNNGSNSNPTSAPSSDGNNGGNNGGNTDNNPKTGTTGIAIAWFAGIFALSAAFFYFKKESEI